MGLRFQVHAVPGEVSMIEVDHDRGRTTTYTFNAAAARKLASMLLRKAAEADAPPMTLDALLQRLG